MNLLTDLPEMTIAADGVDDEMVDSPRRWDIGLIRRFMVVFGVVSSFFDFLTFGVLLWLLRASPTQFRTGWFLESVVSASLIVLVVRTRRRFFQSRPGHPFSSPPCWWPDSRCFYLISHWLPFLDSSLCPLRCSWHQGRSCSST